MTRARITAGLAGCVVLALMGASTFALAKEKPIKQLMGENFVGLQTILVSLITSNYAAVPTHADAIHEHAVELTHMAPKGSATDRQQFLSYAYNLDAHARDMKSIVELLIQHDKDREQGLADVRGAPTGQEVMRQVVRELFLYARLLRPGRSRLEEGRVVGLLRN